MNYQNIYEYLKEEKNIAQNNQNETEIAIADYNDQKADSRTEALEELLIKIHFWIKIIGLYFMIKIIINSIVFIKCWEVISLLLQEISP